VSDEKMTENSVQDTDAGEIGREIITELMGPEFLANRAERINKFNMPLNAYADEVCFGRVWSRPASTGNCAVSSMSPSDGLEPAESAAFTSERCAGLS
jgi:hypothetical protein